jgi:hypothetical protein
MRASGVSRGRIPRDLVLLPLTAVAVAVIAICRIGVARPRPARFPKLSRRSGKTTPQHIPILMPANAHPAPT